MTALLMALAALCAIVTEYDWPLDLPRQLTSSFGEYRAERFHAGIDLRTGGIGLPVHAAADGFVVRVRCSPYGYGKAIYVRLDDGNLAVYGHLNDYYDALRAYVQAAEHQARNYTVDLTPAPAQFRVKRGQVIARSGQTGIGAPHLHYELRDKDDRPINPRLLGVTWADATRPVLNKLIVAPLNAESRVEGSARPMVLPLTGSGAGGYTAPEIHATGKIGVGVDLVDPGEGGYKLGVHTLRVLAGDMEVFEVRNDYLDYGRNHDAVVAYHPYLLDEGRFLLGWRWPGNASPNFTVSKNDGGIEVPKEGLMLVMEAADFAGNKSQALLRVKQGNDGARRGDLAPRVSLECTGDFALCSVHAKQSSKDPVTVSLNTLPVAVNQVGNGVYEAPLRPEKSGVYQVRVMQGADTLFNDSVAFFHRGSGAKASWAGVTLEVKPKSPYGLLCARVTEEPDVKGTGELRVLGPCWRIWPEETPIDDAVELSVPMPSGAQDAARVSLYRKVKSNWEAVDTHQKDGRLIADTQHFGVFAAMEDVMAPEIKNFIVSTRGDGRKRPHISAEVRDGGSGIVNINATCGDQWLLMEYDPERNRIDWARDEDLTDGAAEVRLKVSDNAGNVGTATPTLETR